MTGELIIYFHGMVFYYSPILFYLTLNYQFREEFIILLEKNVPLSSANWNWLTRVLLADNVLFSLIVGMSAKRTHCFDRDVQKVSSIDPELDEILELSSNSCGNFQWVNFLFIQK